MSPTLASLSRTRVIKMARGTRSLHLSQHYARAKVAVFAAAGTRRNWRPYGVSWKGNMTSTATRLAIFVLATTCVCLSIFGAGKADDESSTLAMGGSKIDVSIERTGSGVSQEDLKRWVLMTAQAVTTYYGKFPVPRVAIHIKTFDGDGVRHGQTWGTDGGLIRIRVGNQTSMDELRDDWTMTHEMIHLAFPSVEENHHWAEEGISTYVEPIARIRAGNMDEMGMWRDLVRDMPKGLPEGGDEGLDHTHTWGRTYWGGALFFFVADVEIRKRTQNRKGLEDALRGVLSAGGDIRSDWKLEDAFKAGDRATGVPVLTEMFSKWKDQPVMVDLPEMWKQLGVQSENGRVVLSDDAPLANIRRAITQRGNSAAKPAEK